MNIFTREEEDEMGEKEEGRKMRQVKERNCVQVEAEEKVKMLTNFFVP